MCDDPGFLEAYTDAVRGLMLDQAACGTDLLTDGCVRYDMPLGTLATWDTNNVVYWGGLKRMDGKTREKTVMTSLVGEDYRKSFDKISGLHTADNPSAGAWTWIAEEEPYFGNLGLWTETAKIALPLSDKRRPYKFSGPSFARGAEHVINKTGKSDRDLYFALARVQNKVLREIADSGVKIIQVDYPFGTAPWAAQFHKIDKSVWKELIGAFNEEIAGVNATIWVHFCWGAPILYSHETPTMRWHMADVYPEISEAKADCLQSEAANTGGKYLEQELRAWKEYCSDKDYAVGAATPYNLTETAEDVDRIVDIALKFVPPEKLALTTDEGISGHGVVGRKQAAIKMRLLAEGAKRARLKSR